MDRPNNRLQPRVPDKRMEQPRKSTTVSLDLKCIYIRDTDLFLQSQGLRDQGALPQDFRSHADDKVVDGYLELPNGHFGQGEVFDSINLDAESLAKEYPAIHKLLGAKLKRLMFQNSMVQSNEPYLLFEFDSDIGFFRFYSPDHADAHADERSQTQEASDQSRLFHMLEHGGIFHVIPEKKEGAMEAQGLNLRWHVTVAHGKTKEIVTTSNLQATSNLQPMPPKRLEKNNNEMAWESSDNTLSGADLNSQLVLRPKHKLEEQKTAVASGKDDQTLATGLQSESAMRLKDDDDSINNRNGNLDGTTELLPEENLSLSEDEQVELPVKLKKKHEGQSQGVEE